jgi:hypothetical protein
LHNRKSPQIKGFFAFRRNASIHERYQPFSPEKHRQYLALRFFAALTASTPEYGL